MPRACQRGYLGIRELKAVRLCCACVGLSLTSYGSLPASTMHVLCPPVCQMTYLKHDISPCDLLDSYPSLVRDDAG
jgi:hypothetical protein